MAQKEEEFTVGLRGEKNGTGPTKKVNVRAKGVLAGTGKDPYNIAVRPGKRDESTQDRCQLSNRNRDRESGEGENRCN